MKRSTTERYLALVDNGDLHLDPEQLAVAKRLDVLSAQLRAYEAPSHGLFGYFTSRSMPDPIKGLYLFGGVGRGKTLLMDFFYDAVVIPQKRRAHFHEFMADIHDRIADARKVIDGDPIPHVASALASNVRLLCFDELHVTDIADAMVLSRLFKLLFQKGIVLVATSNAAPDELYRDGLNRELFAPFVDLIIDHATVWELAADRDYRQEKLGGMERYFAPADADAKAQMDAQWQRLAGQGEAEPTELVVKGRRLAVPQASLGAARFDFAALCAKPLGPRDYLTIARTFHTIMIDYVPQLTPDKRNEARRFINLIDALYDNRVILIMSAAAEPSELYVSGDGADLFERTASRLVEMRSADYAELRAGRGRSSLPRSAPVSVT